MIAGRFFVTPHAVERFRARIAPRLSYDQALGVIARSLESADRWKKAKSRPDHYWLRTRRPYALRVLVGPGEGPLPAVVTILPGGRGGRRQQRAAR